MLAFEARLAHLPLSLLAATWEVPDYLSWSERIKDSQNADYRPPVDRTPSPGLDARTLSAIPLGYLSPSTMVSEASYT